jgi:hypothetical protein
MADLSDPERLALMAVSTGSAKGGRQSAVSARPGISQIATSPQAMMSGIR